MKTRMKFASLALILALIWVHPALPATMASERNQVADALLSMYNKNSAKDISRFFDQEKFWQRVKGQLSTMILSFEGIDTSVKDLMRQLPDLLRTRSGEESHWKLLRHSEIDDHRELLFRINLEESFVYWRFRLEQSATGWRIVDWYDHRIGFWYSEFAAHLFTMILPETTHSQKIKAMLLDKPPATVSDYVSAINQDKHEEALQLWHELPETARYHPLLMLFRVDAAEYVSNEAWQKAAADFHHHHKDKPQHHTLLIDYFITQKKIAQTLSQIEALEKFVGDDGPLHYLRASLYRELEKFDSAVEHARLALERDRDFEQTYWLLLDMLVYTARYDDAAFLLGLIERRLMFRFDAEKLAALPDYGKFVESKAYQHWLKQQEGDD